jgi:hypothetical protein
MTRDQLQTRLDAYLAAEARILQAQSTTVGDGATARTRQMTELRAVQTQIDALTTQIAQIDAQAAGSASRIGYLRPAN